MDPQATLDAADRAVTNEDWDTALEFLGYYWNWRNNGGFQPFLGDELARVLQLACEDAIG